MLNTRNIKILQKTEIFQLSLISILQQNSIAIKLKSRLQTLFWRSMIRDAKNKICLGGGRDKKTYVL